MADRFFNLVDEKWIPCGWRDGRADELGLLETLASAHEIREVFDPSPLVTAALHRLLLAILHRNFGPASVEEWRAMWEAKPRGFNKEVLKRYFDDWRSRFDLFDEEHPFYQFPGLDKLVNKRTPLKRLAFEYAVQNNPTLFDHSSDAIRPAFPPKMAARWLLANQAFAPTAGKSSTIHTKDSPWSRGAVILVNGDNLFETLMLNLIPSSLLSGAIADFGGPVWESKDELVSSHGLVPDSYLQYLTLLSRAVRLIPLEDASAATQVSECLFAQGISVTEDFHDDPLLAYTVDEKRGIRVLKLKKDRAVWRDSLALFSIRDKKSFCPPRFMNVLTELVERAVLQKGTQYRLSICGQNLEPGQSKINFWRHERLPLPLAFLADEHLVEDLKDALAKAEATGGARGALPYALWQLAEALGGREKFGDFVKHLGAERLFWSRLEAPFHSFLTGLPGDRNGVLQAWPKTLHHVAWAAFEDATRDLDGSARTLRAVVQARGRLSGALARALRDQ